MEIKQERMDQSGDSPALPVCKGKRWCAAPNCGNFRGKMTSLSFFKFPKNKERCEMWIKNSGREDLFDRDITTLYDSGFCICAEHFDISMFMNPRMKNKLVSHAVPTVFEYTGSRQMLLMPSMTPSQTAKLQHPKRKEPVTASASQNQPNTRPSSIQNNGHSSSSYSASGQFVSTHTDPAEGPEAANLLEGPCRPMARDLPNGCFPRRRFGQSSRCFQEAWYLQYPWLEYSISKDASFCFYCRLSAAQLPFRSERLFIYEGYRYWKNASQDIRLHSKGKAHLQSKAAYERRRGAEPSSSTMLQQNKVTRVGVTPKPLPRATEIKTPQNADVQQQQQHTVVRKGIAKILDLILFLARRNLLTNEEHLLEFLRWHSNYDRELVTPLFYASGLLQNCDQLLQFFGDAVRHVIVGEVRQLANGYFSLLCDKLVEGGNGNPVLCIYVRYVTKYLQVHEKFLGCWQLEGSKMKDSMWPFLQDLLLRLGLSPSKLRGLSFGVLGPRKPWQQLQAEAETQFQFASSIPATWCYFRPLHQTVWEQCRAFREVRSVCHAVSRFHHFVRFRPTFGTGKDDSMTWAAFSGSGRLCRLREHLRSVIGALQDMVDGRTSDDCAEDDDLAEAEFLLETFTKFQFVCFLHLYTRILSAVDAITAYFEDEANFSVEELLEMASDASERLQRMRNGGGAGGYFETLLDDVKRETDKLGIAPPSSSPPDGWGDGSTELDDDMCLKKFSEMCQLVEVQVRKDFDEKAYRVLVDMDRLITNRCSRVVDHVDRVVGHFGSGDFDRDRLLDDVQQFYDVIECDSESARMDLKSSYDIATYFISNNFTDEFPEFNKLLCFYLAMPICPPHPDRSLSILKKLHTQLTVDAMSYGGRQLDDAFLLAIESDQVAKMGVGDGQPEILDVLVDKFIQKVDSQGQTSFSNLS